MPRRPAPPPARPAFQHSVLDAVLGELHPRGTQDAAASRRGLRLPRERLAQALLLALALTGLLLLLRPFIATLWADELVWWITRMELSGQASAHLDPAELPFLIATPQVQLFIDAPSTAALMYNAIAVVALWWLAGLLPDAARPAGLLLRAGCVIHGAAVLFFWRWPASFPHAVGEHIGHGLQQCWLLMLLAPWLHLAIHWLHDVGWHHRLTLTLLTWLYLFLLAPLLYATHALVLHAGGLLAMPLLHLMFGVVVAVIGIVALYGWAMSWSTVTPPRLPRAG